MSPLAVPYLAAGILLAYAGWTKVRSPRSTVLLAETLGLSLSRATARALAAAELALGVWAVLSGALLPALVVGVVYTGFAVFVTWGLTSGDLASCGCFADDEAEPRPLHVVVDALLALTAFGVAATSAPAGLLSAVDTTSGWALVVLGAAAALLGYVVLSRLPVPAPVSPQLERGAS